VNQRLTLTLDGATLVFTPPRSGVAGAYALLTSIDTIREAIQAPHIGEDAEAPSLTVTLDNSAGQVRSLIGIPLRAPAVVSIDDVTVFSGVVASVTAGLAYVLTLEA